MVTTQEAKRFLERARDARRQADLAMAITRRLNEDYGVSGMRYDTPRVQTSAAGDALERLAIAREEAVLRLTIAVRDALDVQRRIFDLIQQLEDPDDMVVLTVRYLEGTRYEDLSEALATRGVYVGQRQACRLLSRAIGRFAQIMDRAGVRAA